MEIGVLESAGLTTTMVTVILILYKLFKNMDGRRIRSSCCGYNASIGFQTEQMSPVVVMVENPAITIRSPE